MLARRVLRLLRDAVVTTRRRLPSVNPTSPTQTERTVAVSVFDNERRAGEASQALRDLGFDERQLTLLTAVSGDVREALLSLGVPEGEVRFYSDEIENGHAV